jgi:hypothetical protein
VGKKQSFSVLRLRGCLVVCLRGLTECLTLKKIRLKKKMLIKIKGYSRNITTFTSFYLK